MRPTALGPRFRLHLALDADADARDTPAPLDQAAALLAPFGPLRVQHRPELNPKGDKRRSLLGVEALSRARSSAGMSGAVPAGAAEAAAGSSAPESNYATAASSAAPPPPPPPPQTPSRAPRTSQLAADAALTPSSPRAGGADRAGPFARWERTGSFGGADASAQGGSGSGEWEAAKEKEVAFGTVHIFRLDAASGAAAAPETDRTTVLTDDSEEDAGTILAVLAVPSHIHAADWLAFVEGAVEALEHVRIIRESSPGRVLILCKFRDAIDAEYFYKEYNNVPFNAMHPDLCRIVYVTAITLSSSAQPPSSALANADPWPLPAPGRRGEGGLGLELPTCPVCLDRMDSSVTGLMTNVCEHSFHCACLSRWEDSRCPVCRYSQSRRGRGALLDSSDADETAGDQESRESACAVCGTQEDLWVCLICAAVGCGRYRGGHAHSHFNSSAHAYSLELETQRVWSYVEDAYVHRLIQSKADGKLVELPSGVGSGANATAAPMRAGGSRDVEREERGERGMGRAEENEKLEAMGKEYSFLLTSQLDTQRSFYEAQVRGAQSKLADALSALDAAHASTSSSSTREAALSARVSALEAEAERAQAASARSEARMLKALEVARRAQSELEGERSVGQGLMRRLEKEKEREEKLAKDVETLKSQNEELQEQMRDLMFFIDARDKLKDGEAAGGDIEGVAEAKKKGKKKKK